MSSENPYCTAPWNGLTIREDGYVRTCCVGQTSLGNLNTESIYSIEQSPALKHIQQVMLSGQPDFENCQSCLDNEKHNGLATLRQHYNTYYPTIDPTSLKLKFVDVRWNNTCNLGCLYCQPKFSNTWENRLGSVKQGKPVKEYQDELLSWILERADHVSEIMLVGGEPMLMKQNYALLSRLPDQCNISIITNLSYDLENLPCWPDLVRRDPTLINWNISIENTHNKFEYVRSGSSWSQIQKNFKLLTTHWPETISLNMVYSVFSAFDLVDTLQHFRSLGVKKFNLFPIDGNLEINVFNMPIDVQRQAFEILEIANQEHTASIHPEDRNLYQLKGIEPLLTFLKQNINRPSTITLDQFDSKIAWYNQWGNDQFSDLWPELNEKIRAQLTCINSKKLVY